MASINGDSRKNEMGKLFFAASLGHRTGIDIDYISVSALAGFEEAVGIVAGGLRIKKIIVDDNNGNQITKEYEYSKADGMSSGVLESKPNYVYPIFEQRENQTPCIYTAFTSNDQNPLSTVSGSHIHYARVLEKFGEGAEYGVVEHIFTSGLDYPDERISIFPFPPPISSREWRKGKLKAQNIFDSSNNLLKSVENEYEARPSPYSESKGLKVGGLMYNVITAPSQVGYIAVQYKHISEWFALKSASETLDGAVKNSAFFYDGNGTPTAPVAIEFVNSDGKTHRAEFVYAPQAAHSGCMMGKYMVGIAVETKELINGNPASGAKAEYAPDNGRCLPKRYYAWEGAWELRTEITQYDSDAFPEIVSHTALPEPEYYSWANGLLSSKTYKDWRQTWGYYSDTRLMESFTDIDGQTINYSYDGFQRLKTVLAREGNVSSSYVYQYGAPNRITNTTAYTDDTPTQTIEEEFDGLGRLVKQSHNGVPKQEIFYDNAGRIARETYLVGSYVKYINEPSPLGRVLITTFPDGYKVQNKYSSENNYYKTTTIDEKGNASDVLTDFLGRQGKFRDALGGETVFSYDTQGDLASVANPGGGQYLYTYDLGHRVESKAIPGKGMQVFRYYTDNKLLKYSLDANGNRLDYTYDDYNREKLVRFNDIGNWDPMAIPPSHGSPGSKILEYGYGEGTGEPINIGKMMWSDAKVLDGTGTNFVNTKFTYETYGRLDGQYETHPLGFDSYDFIYNLADWLTFEDRTHLGPQSIDMRTVRKYDRFGRETGYFIFAGPGSGNYISDGFILGRSYNIKDQVKAKYYGSLDAFSALDKVKFKYNIRGWVTDMNDIVYDELQFDECGTAFGLHGDTVQIEQTVALEELLEIICTEGEEVAINGLDPCANGDCYEVLSDYSARFIVGAFEGYHGFQSPDYLWGVRANGQLIPLNYPYYFHDGSSRNQFVTDLGNWMAQNGWRHESISFTADLVNQGVKRPYYDVSIVVTGTDLNFEIAYEGRDVANQVAHPFSVKHRPPVLCSGLPESPSGEGQDVETVKGLLEQEIANQALDNLALPAVLYKTHFPDSSYYWAFGQELKNIPAIYQRSKRVHVSNGQQSLFLEGETEGEGESVALEEFIDNRGSMVMPKGIHDGGPPSDECDLPELECTETEIEEQYESVAEIQNEMCNIDPANLEYPVTMYLVQLCDGTRMYILGANLLSQLEGTYLILDELVIESPAQEFDIVVTQRRPLFAMKFEAYEPNGNIKELRWKITNRAPKYYTYSYDALNRVTGAPYGFLYRSPSQGILAVQSNQYAAPSFGYDAVGNITAIKRMGMVAGVDCFEPKTIDNLDLDYEPMSHRLLKVKDTAPTDGRPHGFKPGANDNALYQHDDNGNMTYDPHKGLSMHYNFLNLPSQIGQMRLTYDATGRKWSKDGEFGVTSYVSGIEYHDGKLEAIYAPDGRMVAEYTNGQITRYRAEYFHQDHLGNTRLGFSDFNQNGRIDLEEENPATPVNELEVTQESHYYPFGMNHDGPWYATVAPENKYLYNGKELNEDYEANLYDYQRRWYDPAIARWTTIDPVASAYRSWSPYQYALNNPLKYIDPDGAIIEFADRGAENLYNYVYKNASDEMKAMFEKLRNSDVVYKIALTSEGGEELRGSIGNTSLGVYDDEDGYTEVNIYITDGDHDEDARYQIGALADELTHAAQFEDGEIGYDANRKDNAIAYDFGDEIESREKAVEAAERCACEPASDNALLADPSISREDKLNLLHSRGYRFNSSDGREKVLDVINNPSKSQSLKNSGVNRIIYRENGTTKHKDLK